MDFSKAGAKVENFHPKQGGKAVKFQKIPF
jgi:hypothetical protein